MATKAFYENLYGEVSTDKEAIDSFFNQIPRSEVANTESETLVRPISKEEVVEAIKHSPRNKAAGPDGIPFEVYHNLVDLVTEPLVQLYNIILGSPNWSILGGELAYIILLYKKGDKKSLANWRPIALSNCIDVEGQPPTRCLAFADDCVVGLSQQEDVKTLSKITELYEKASNAKLNRHKTMIVPIGNLEFEVPFPLHPPVVPFRHLGVFFNNQGVAVAFTEAMILQRLRDKVGGWRTRNISMAEDWAEAANKLIISYVPKICKDNHWALAEWLSINARRNGPHQMPKQYKGYLKVIKWLQWSIYKEEFTNVSGMKGVNYHIVDQDGCKTPQGAPPVMPVEQIRTPKLWAETPEPPQIKLRKLWRKVWTPLVTPRHQSNTWKFFSQAYCTGDRQSASSPFRKCANCGAQKETHLHRFFECPFVYPVWQAIWHLLTGNPPDPRHKWEPLKWFLEGSSLKAPNAIRVLTLHITLWNSHSNNLAV
ncbi:hypothetical protein FRX31_031518, partial [Thalictrum thalictroides]